MKGMKCVCGKMAAYKENLKFNNYDIDGWVCKDCGEIYYNPTKAEKILLLNKLKNKVFHLKLSQVKSNLVLRIPKEVGDVLGLHKGEELELRLQDSGGMILKPTATS